MIGGRRPDLLRGLDDVDWASLHDAYGSAAAVPRYLRDAVAPDKATRDAGSFDLWSAVCHQGDVYDCGPVLVPFLVEVVTSTDLEDAVRFDMAFLLAALASASTSVPPPGEPARDVPAECQAAVAAHAAALAAAFDGAPPETTAGLVAVFAAVAEHAPERARARLAALEGDANPKLAAAARLAGLLADGAVTPALLAEIAAVDENAADFIVDNDDPLSQVAVQVAFDLAAAALSA